MKKDFISILDFTKSDIEDVFAMAKTLKKKPFSKKNVMKNKVAALIFEKPSSRTRISFQVGIIELGGESLYLGHDIKFGKREPVKDIARVVSRYIDLAVLRTFKHSDVSEFAEYAGIPVINGLSDKEHPCQALADLFTIKEKFGSLKGKTLSYIGDSNNVLNSLLFSSALAGLNINAAAPNGYEPAKEILDKAKELARKNNSSINISNDPKAAIKAADVIYTDVWVSMGQEDERSARMSAFGPFQINKELLKNAKKDVYIMHCLPAHRQEEITDDVIEGKNSVVFDQAENRLHVQKAIIAKLIK